jgi:hypothetical protein
MSNPSILSQRQQDVGGTLGAVVTSSLTVLGAPFTITADRN